MIIEVLSSNQNNSSIINNKKRLSITAEAATPTPTSTSRSVESLPTSSSSTVVAPEVVRVDIDNVIDDPPFGRYCYRYSDWHASPSSPSASPSPSVVVEVEEGTFAFSLLPFQCQWQHQQHL
jgi:hypothetical protein